MFEKIVVEFFETLMRFTEALTVPYSLDEKDWE